MKQGEAGEAMHHSAACAHERRRKIVVNSPTPTAQNCHDEKGSFCVRACCHLQEIILFLPSSFHHFDIFILKEKKKENHTASLVFKVQTGRDKVTRQQKAARTSLKLGSGHSIN